jgi:hypothetical protein
MSLSDRDMAVIFEKDAADYIRAVFELGCDEDSIRLVAPTYFMRSHAIELLLKACLLANGWTVRECKGETRSQIERRPGFCGDVRIGG